MPFKCRTTAGLWESRITPTRPPGPERPDGDIEVDDDAANFVGTHHDTGGLIIGTCTGSTGPDCAGECRITFRRRSREGRRLYQWEYDAYFKAEDAMHKTIDGRYTKTLIGAARDRLRVDPEEEGTWVASKPVT